MLDDSTFDYMQPTTAQKADMLVMREAAKVYAEALDAILPDGPDKEWAIRNHRTTAMWATVAITRWHDGAPRQDKNSPPQSDAA